MKYTSTPWRIVDLRNQKNGKLTIRGPGLEHIANLFDNDDANAELIVRAVNAHDDLLEACKLSLRFVRSTARQFHTGRDETSIMLEAALEDVIAKATGGE